MKSKKRSNLGEKSECVMGEKEKNINSVERVLREKNQL